jgi:hypothetical protein
VLLPLVVPDVPAVDPPVELVPDDVDPLPPLGVAFVKMNDAPDVDPDGDRDAVDPEVDEPPVLPDVPAVLPASPRCRHPTTVIVPV